MKNASFKTAYITGALAIFSLVSFAQSGTVTISQDPEISNLLKLKKEINAADEDGDRYKISIYSGSRTRAESTKNTYDNLYYSWASKLVYETPNYKVYVGNFRTALDRDRALKRIKRKFPNAFPFKVKKD